MVNMVTDEFVSDRVYEVVPDRVDDRVLDTGNDMHGDDD